jgi:methyl-accepting chemotaxis protein
LVAACEEALAPLSQNAQLGAEGAAAIDATLNLVRTAVASLEQVTLPVSEDTDAVAAHVERMYIGFQYQDRISQMIALLETDIARLSDALNGQGEAPPDLEGWLSRLESQYAMSEQHQVHSGDSGAGQGDGADDEATFF